MNWKALVTFQQMIVLCDSDGVVDITQEALHFRTGIPLEILKEGIKELESSDKRSRSLKNNGCRIIRLDAHRDWGWKLVNHKYYRDLATHEEKKERDKIRMREKRANKRSKIRGVAGCSDQSQDVCDVAYTDTDTDKDKKENIKRKRLLPKDYVLTKKEIVYANKKGVSKNIPDIFEGFCIHHKKKGSKFVDWNAAWQTWIRNHVKFNGADPKPPKIESMEEIEARLSVNE